MLITLTGRNRVTANFVRFTNRLPTIANNQHEPSSEPAWEGLGSNTRCTSMAQAHSRETGHDTRPAGIGWRAFQLLGLLTALSWIVSYTVFLNGFEALGTVFAGTSPLWTVGGIAYFLSPAISVVLIGISVWPRALAVLDRGGWTAMVARSLLFAIPVLWLGTTFVGAPSMLTGMLNAPLGHSTALPIFGGAFVHTVFQHWFQGFAAIALALAPGRFEVLTDAERPAGIQCSFLQCG